MTTIIFYNFILFISTIFVWLSEKFQGRIDRYFLLTISFLLVFIPSAVRSDIGTDFQNYVVIYNNLQDYKWIEPGFYFLNWSIKSMDADSQWIFAISAFLFTAFAYAAYPKKNAWLLHLLFFSSLWLASFNIIRQVIMLSITLFAIFKYFDKKYKSFIAFSFLGFIFHSSALIIMIIGLAALIPLKNTIKTKIIPIIFISFFIFSYLNTQQIFSFIEQLLNILNLQRYADYFSNQSHFIRKDFGSGLGVYIKLVFLLYIIINTKNFIKYNQQCWFLILLIFFYSISMILASQIVIFGRMMDIFSLAPIVSAYFLTLIPGNRKIHNFFIFGFTIFLILSFNKEGLSIKTSYSDPKLNPYSTIIDI